MTHSIQRVAFLRKETLEMDFWIMLMEFLLVATQIGPQRIQYIWCHPLEKQNPLSPQSAIHPCSILRLYLEMVKFMLKYSGSQTTE